MSCEQTRSLLSEQFERSLNPAEETDLQAHLDRCEACSRFSETLRIGMSRIAALLSVPANPGIRSAVHRTARKRGPSRSRCAAGWAREWKSPLRQLSSRWWRR
jgi:predicted anti-sigma-YlaC factor YlaD